MTQAEFERVVRETLDALPPRFHRFLENVAVVVEDEPDEEALGSAGLEPGHELFGLYHGVSLLDREAGYAGLPDRISIYRGPILRCCGSRHEIIEEIRQTVIHELGHHMGLDDDEMVY